MISRVPATEASLAASISSASWVSPGCGCLLTPGPRDPGPRQSGVAPSRGLRVRRVLAEHAEQPPHLGQPGPRGVADLKEPPRPASGSPGIVSRPVSACTAIIEMWCATTSCSSLAIRARSPRAVCATRVSASASPASLYVRAARPARSAIPAPAAIGTPDASSTHARFSCRASASTRNGSASPTARYCAPAGPTGRGHGPQLAVRPEPPGGEYRAERPGDGRRGKHGEHEHVGERRDDRRPRRPQEQQRHRRQQGERAQCDGVQEAEHLRVPHLAAVREAERHRLADRLPERGQREQRARRSAPPAACRSAAVSQRSPMPLIVTAFPPR